MITFVLKIRFFNNFSQLSKLVDYNSLISAFGSAIMLKKVAVLAYHCNKYNMIYFCSMLSLMSLVLSYLIVTK